jgi:hypothetical protein
MLSPQQWRGHIFSMLHSLRTMHSVSDFLQGWMLFSIAMYLSTCGVCMRALHVKAFFVHTPAPAGGQKSRGKGEQQQRVRAGGNALLGLEKVVDVRGDLGYGLGALLGRCCLLSKDVEHVCDLWKHHEGLGFSV